MQPRGRIATRSWSQVIIGVDPDPAGAPALRDWAVGYWEALHPYSAGGAYVNFMMDEGQERVKATYGELRPAREGEGDVRPEQPVPRQPEHQACCLAPPDDRRSLGLR